MNNHTNSAQIQQNPNPIPNQYPYPNQNPDQFPSNPSTGCYPNPDPYNQAYYYTTSVGQPQQNASQLQLTVSYQPAFQPQQSAYYPDPNAGWAASYGQSGPTPHATIETYNAQYQHQPQGMDPQYVTQTVSYGHNPAAFQQQQSADAAPAAYYAGSNVGLVAPYGVPGATTHAAGVTLPNTANRFHRNTNRKNAPKKTKIVQSTWCEVCKIACDTKDVFDKHKLGKKHKKNLEKLRGPTNTTPPLAITPAPAITPAYLPLPVPNSSSIDKPVIGPQGNPNKDLSYNARKAKKKKAAAVEDLESKRIKVLKGGASADAVRTCVYCNVVCNSETVFNYHIAGQKHAAMVTKFAAVGGGASASVSVV